MLAMLLAAAVTADRPNVLFAISDDQSFPHCSAYGCRWVDTPGFDRVARGGLLFTNCYTPNAKCAPSRACVLTGRNSWQLEAAANHVFYFPPKFKTWVEALGEAGYRTGMTAKGLAPSVNLAEGGDPRFPTGKPYNAAKLEPPTTGITKTDYAGNFEAFLDDGDADTPWSFWYGCVEPHRRYEYGTGAKLAGKDPRTVDEVPDYWPDNEVVRNDMLDYAFEIEHFDSHLVRMLDLLEERGQLENTLVIVTADNGMPFPRVKGNAYERSNHLPLAIMWAAAIKEPGRTVEDFVSFIDFAPTVLEAAGVSDHGMASITGRSLMPVFQSPDAAHRDHVLIGKERHDLGRPGDAGYPVRGLVDGRFTYLRNFKPDRWPAGNPETGYMNTDGSPTKTLILDQRRAGADRRYWDLCFGKLPAEELFDRVADPLCVNNLAGNPAYAADLKRLKEQMTAELTAEEDPRILGNGDVFETYPYSQPRMQGFYEKFTSGWTDEKGRGVRAGWIQQSDVEPGPIRSEQ